MSEWSEGYEVGYSNGRDVGERAGLERAAKMLLGEAEQRGYERAQREIAAAIEAAAARIREGADSTSAGIALGAVLAEGARIARSALAVPLPEGETQKLTDGPTLTSEGAT